MQKIMGIDYGDARTGVAISDLLCSIVGSTCVVPSRNTEKALDDILQLVKQNDVGRIVVGLPKNMDSSVGERAQKCIEFAERLSKVTGIEAVMRDERLSTVSAHNVLNNTNTRGKKRKNVVDQVAAVMILQDYIDYRKNK